MAFPNDVLQTPGGNAALQTISVLFNAASLLSGALRPPFKTAISPGGLPTPLIPAAALLDVLTLDVTLQEVHTANSEVTEHPVEVGADISDHVRPKPIELRIEGLVSDTPIDDSLIGAAVRAIPGLGLGVATIGSVKTLLTGGSSLTKQAFDSLRRIRDNGSPCGIFTPYRSYSNMVMDSLVVTRDKETGESLRFTATFREIILVSSGITSITLPASAQGAQDMGTQGTPTASAKQIKSVSTLYGGINTATGGGLDTYKAWVGQ